MEQKNAIKVLGGSVLRHLGRISEWPKLPVLNRIGQREEYLPSRLLRLNTG